MHNFPEKIALITGGTEGIGLATAILFAQANAKVFIVGRSEDKGATALAALKKITPDVYFHAADMSKPDEVAAMVTTCMAVFGRLDFAVNNAAASFPLVPTADIPIEAIDHSINTDLRGVWCCMKYEIDVMLKNSGGAIVNVSSVNGFLASPNAAMYSATKHGVNGLTAAAAKEYAALGIRINTVCPGAIETPRRQQRLQGKTEAEIAEQYAGIKAQIPLRRIGRADEVAAAILWLCSDDASYVIGHHLVVDGGLSA